jgi:hypothetical protein
MPLTKARSCLLVMHLGCGTSSALNTSMSVAVNFIARCDGSTLGCFSFRAQGAGATAVRYC